MVVSAQLRILNDTIRNLKEDAESEYQITFKTVYKKNSLTIHGIMERKLIECVHHHWLIKK